MATKQPGHQPGVGALSVTELADLLPVGVFTTDAEGRCTYVSRPWCELSGLAPDAALGWGWVDGLHPDDRAAVRRAWHRFVDGLDPLSVEFRFRRPDDRTRWVRAQARAERDERGRFLCAVGTITKLTDRRAVLTRVTQILERGSEMVAVTDPTGAILWANDATEPVLGPDRAARLGTSIFDLVHPDDRKRATEGLACVTAEETPAPVQIRALGADGTWRELEVVATNLLDEPAVRGIALSARDLTERRDLERRVHELEHRFDAAFELSLVGRALVDLHGAWLQVNAAFAAMLGRRPEELLGGYGIEVVHPEDRARVRAEVTRLVRGEVDRASVVTRFVRPDGATVWVRFTVWHVNGGDGEPLYLATDAIDITEQLTAAAERAAVEEWLRALLEHSSDLLIVLDAELRVSYLSSAAEGLVGLPASETIGMAATELVHPDDLGLVRARLAAVLAEPGATGRVSCRVRHRDGSYRWVEAMGQNLLDHPAVGGLVINARDITERLRSEAALRATQAHFEALVEHASDLITVNDLEGNLSYVSPSSASLLGYEPSELEGTSARDLIHPDDVERLERSAAEQFERGVAEPIHYRARHRDGSWREFEAIVTDLIEEPSVVGVVTNARDVTERRFAERRASGLVEILEATNELVVVSDVRGTILYANRSARALLGARERQHVSELSSPTSRERLRGEIMPEVRRRGAWSGELELIDRDGRELPVAVTVQAHRDDDGNVARLATIAHDISELKAAQRRLEFDATHDGLTSLPNRALFREIGERALSRARRTHDEVAVLFLDLDGFKLVNDSYGHDTGDLLLGMVARRLREAVRAGDVLARLGGDEFVILCETPRGEHPMLELSERIIETVSRPFAIDGHEVRVGLSIGIAFSQGCEESIGALIRDADVALYRAKHEGRGRAQLFDDSLL
jgi:diguanylate cyclase (GGDEF)-like protein/PAS domain S-box-containing protein